MNQSPLAAAAYARRQEQCLMYVARMLAATIPPESERHSRRLGGGECGDLLRITRIGTDAHQVWIGGDGPFLIHGIVGATYCRVVDMRPLPTLLSPEVINEHAGIRPLLTEDGLLLACEIPATQMTTNALAQGFERLHAARYALNEILTRQRTETTRNAHLFSEQMQRLYGEPSFDRFDLDDR